jgi:hypothetical protein
MSLKIFFDGSRRGRGALGTAGGAQALHSGSLFDFAECVLAFSQTLSP